MAMDNSSFADDFPSHQPSFIGDIPLQINEIEYLHTFFFNCISLYNECMQVYNSIVVKVNTAVFIAISIANVVDLSNCLIRSVLSLQGETGYFS